MNFTSIEKAYTYSQSELILKKTKKQQKRERQVILSVIHFHLDWVTI